MPPEIVFPTLHTHAHVLSYWHPCAPSTHACTREYIPTHRAQSLFLCMLHSTYLLIFVFLWLFPRNYSELPLWGRATQLLTDCCLFPISWPLFILCLCYITSSLWIHRCHTPGTSCARVRCSSLVCFFSWCWTESARDRVPEGSLWTGVNLMS